MGLTLGAPDNSYDGQVIDIGRPLFNWVFRNTTYFIIKRECPSCASEDNKVIYYKRLTGGSTFDAYSYMKVWRSSNNVINVNFALYSSLEDAIYDRNRWQYCNYDDLKVGAFRDCGKTAESKVGCDWTSDVLNGGHNYAHCGRSTKFSIYIGTDYDTGTAAKQQFLPRFDKIHPEEANVSPFRYRESYYLISYLVYGLISLLIINIICLGLYCVRKNKKTYSKYEVVSMESSDNDTDVDNV